MSLDITLESQKEDKICFHCGSTYKESNNLFEVNITHNLARMASACGLYMPMWYPEDMGAVYAKDIISALSSGIGSLKADPEKYKQFNPANGWGNYEGLVRIAEEYLDACNQYPNSKISVSR